MFLFDILCSAILKQLSISIRDLKQRTVLHTFTIKHIKIPPLGVLILDYEHRIEHGIK